MQIIIMYFFFLVLIEITQILIYINARMITALAFVPPVNVVESFEMLCEELERVEPTLQPILDWLEMYYIGIL